MILKHYLYCCKHFPPPLASAVLGFFYGIILLMIFLGFSAAVIDMRYFNI